MTRETIVEKVLSLTPGELQHVLNVIHGWAQEYGDDEERIAQVHTGADVVELLSSPEYDYGNFDTEEYFSEVFDL